MAELLEIFLSFLNDCVMEKGSKRTFLHNLGFAFLLTVIVALLLTAVVVVMMLLG